ncbi:hypothetical protein APLC1_0454 [Limnospira platensis C1]|nr:hypothetical protein APLC1_0454 [Arthrospira platensis C1]
MAQSSQIPYPQRATKSYHRISRPTTSQPQPINHQLFNSRNSFLDHLRNHRCLIILDDFQETLNPGELVGNYRPEYQNYSHLLHEIGRCSHQSCLLLLGWEQP